MNRGDDDDRQRLPGRLSRTLRTAWLGGSVGGTYLRGRIADAFRDGARREAAASKRHEESARRVLDTLKELRGPVMKIGQLVSTHEKLVPFAFVEELGSLQEHAPPMRFSTIRRVIEDDLGAPVEALFTTLGETAVAAASLGQVHRGTLPDGTLVAVKVQYPGAEDSTRGDVKNIALGARMIKSLLADTLGRERFDVTPMAEELAEHLLQETDYCREAYNAKLIASLFVNDPLVVVPRVYDSHSGLRVITYEWLEGEPLDFGLLHDDRAIRERTVTQLTHVFWHQLFRGGVLHADPHAGNYRILTDGRLGLLDYGCVKIFSEAFVREFAEMVLARMDGDEPRLERAMLALGLVGDEADEAQIEDVRKLADYCSAGLQGEEEFDFATYSYVAEGRALFRHFLSRGSPPPSQRDFLFLTRVVLGYYEYFSRARAKMPFRALVRPYIEGGFAGRVIEVLPYG
jgi:predicted unusual protein kinase regulating ubiquinone biosynthesis (AarF/ABC1/UbiB family)